MAAITFDTHRIVKRLKDSGFSEAQAETVTDVFREVRESDLSQLVTKDDLRHEIEILKRDITIRMGGMLVVAVGAVATLVKLL